MYRSVGFHGQNDPTFERDKTFEHFKTLQPTLAKHDNVSYIQDAHCQSVLIMYVEIFLIFLRNMPEKFPQYRQFTRQNAPFNKKLLLFFAKF